MTHTVSVKKITMVFVILIGSFLTSGCWALLGRALIAEELALLSTRGALTRASVAGMSAGLGGEAFVATRIAQGNLGSIIAADFAAGRLAGSTLRLQIGEGAAATAGRATMSSGSVNVAFADGKIMRVTIPKPSQSATGLFSEHYIGSQRVSYARLTPNGARYDYFIRNSATGNFDRALYALRDPSGRSIAFFGPNHSYLGKAIYRTQGAAANADGLAAGVTAVVSLTDYQTTPYSEQCAQELVNLRLTYFNTGEVLEAPEQFWESLYRDCSKNNDVAVDYQSFKMRGIYAIVNRDEKLQAAKKFLVRFPSNDDAKFLVRDLEGVEG
jgi:hypothetical protein